LKSSHASLVPPAEGAAEGWPGEAALEEEEEEEDDGGTAVPLPAAGSGVETEQAVSPAIPAAAATARIFPMMLLQPSRGMDLLPPAKLSAVQPTQPAAVVHSGEMGTTPLCQGHMPVLECPRRPWR
jgi:hypothetical protein